MKKMNKWLVAGLVIVAILIGAYFVGGSSLQGRLTSSEFDQMTADFSVWAGSPSGARSVTIGDTLLIFDVTPLGSLGYGIKNGSKMDVTFDVDSGDIGANANGLIVNLEDGRNLACCGPVVGTGFVVVTPQIDDQMTVEITLNQNIKIPTGTTASFTLRADTTNLLAVDPGVDDPLDITFKYDEYSFQGNNLRY